MYKKISATVMIVLLSLLFVVVNKNNNKGNTVEAEVFESGKVNYVSLLINNINRENAEFRVSPVVAARNMNYIMLAGYLAYINADDTLDAESSSLAAALRAASYIYGTEKETSWISHLEIGSKNDRPSMELGNKIGDKVIEIAKKDNYIETYKKRLSWAGANSSKERYSWVSTGRDEAGLEPDWGSLTHIIKDNKKCILPAPNINEVETQAKIMLENYSDKNAMHADVFFWLAGVATDTPPGQWMRILSNKLTLDKDMSLKEKFKIATIAAISNYDVSIQLWAEKYRHNLIRPESLWKKNGVTVILPRETPNHPSYPSGHSGFASATGEVIKHFLGNGEITLSLPADLYSVAEGRIWSNVDQAIAEAGNSRVLAAFHYPMDVNAGVSLGQCISNNVISGFDLRVKEILL
jgi:hypothetical protein